MTATLTNISPLDGRYHQQTQPLRHLMSEFGLIHHRLIVKVDWVITLAQNPDISEIPTLNTNQLNYLKKICNEFSPEDAQFIKDIEKTTNHDVKAIEYFLQEYFKNGPDLESYIPFIHFGCTSEDVNNVAYALMIKKTIKDIMEPKLTEILLTLDKLAIDYADIPMLSRTHGQPATPTTMGKEIRNVEQRLHQEFTLFQHIQVLAKFNGATGNFNAHHVAYPNINWPMISQHFIESLGLTPNNYTIQIEPHDYIARLMHSLMRMNVILIDLARDFWGYIALNYFKQRTVANEVGSSTMPHKVNPIDFENAEGNLGVANSIAGHLAEKLPISRWQRDLTDSTVLRNLGVAFGHSLLAYNSLEKGIHKLEVNAELMLTELDNCWALLAEPVQTMLRRYGITDAYEQLKALTRGQEVNQKTLRKFIKKLDIPQEAKNTLLNLTPSSYIGYAADLARKKI